MSFTSLTFAGFFAVVLALYWLAGRKAWQNFILLAASYVFYGWIHPWVGILLGFSTAADFFLALGMARARERTRMLLSISLLLNLGVLAFFKYYNFFNDALAQRLAQLGLPADFLLVGLALPAGLSFYTLKKLSYMLDVSRGTFKPVTNAIDFALYVAFFPQIVAGPIERPQKLLPQIQAERRWSSALLASAWPLLVMGFFKKVVIADTIKSIVDRIYSLDEPSKLIVLVGTLGFTLQILADFSAYTDLSRGVARLLGFDTVENFNRPYLALSPSEFWNRWHISLSSFLRDYVFFPLRRSLLRRKTWPGWVVQAFPPLVTMFISGLWHGAGWTYLAWGIYYGLLIVGYQLAGIQGEWKPRQAAGRIGAWLLMFAFIVFGWLLFRAPSLEWVARVLFNAPWVAQSDDFIMALVVLSMTAFYAAPLVLKMWLDRTVKPDSWWLAVYYAVVLVAVILYTNSSNPDFIYFQF